MQRFAIFSRINK